MNRAGLRAGRTMGVILMVCVSLGWMVVGAGSMDWETELVTGFSGTACSFDGSFTSFRAGYGWGDVDGVPGSETSYGSGNSFGENGSAIDVGIRFPLPPTTSGTFETSVYHKSDLVIDWPVGTWGVVGNAVFSIQSGSMTRFSLTANVTAYGSSTTVAFSLVPVGTVYAAGLTLELAGTTFSGMGFSLAGTFGTSTGTQRQEPQVVPPEDPCALPFQKAVLGFEGFPWACIHTDVDVSLAASGFTAAKIDVDIDLWDGLIALDGSLDFTVAEKQLQLIQRIQIDQQQEIWVNVGIEPTNLGPGNSTLIDQFLVRGWGATDCDVGTADLTVIASFVGGLYKPKDSADIDLDAGGYSIALDPEAKSSQFVQTDYLMVCTLDGAVLNDVWALDANFGAGMGTLFDLALFTVLWEHPLSAEVGLRFGLQLDPRGASYKVLVGLDMGLVLP